MSKTYRRAGKDGQAIFRQWYPEGKEVYVGLRVPAELLTEESTLIKKAVVKGKVKQILKRYFCSDSYETMANSPAWYRRDLNRKLRSKQNQYLKRKIIDGEFDDYAEPKFVKDCVWYW